METISIKSNKLEHEKQQTDKNTKNTAWQYITIADLSQLQRLFSNWLIITQKGLFCKPKNNNGYIDKKTALKEKLIYDSETNGWRL